MAEVKLLSKKSNNLLMGTKNENVDLISYVTGRENDYQKEFTNYFKESLQNYKRVAGYIYSKADLAKLNEEERPSHVYNLLLPKIMNLAGSFLDNQSKVEADPRTPGDFGMANILTDLLDYVHYTANDLPTIMTAAYLCSTIGRVGWVYGDYSYEKDREGVFTIQIYDPFRLMWNTATPIKEFRKCDTIIDRAWYSLEEILTLFANDDQDKYDEIMEKGKMYFGEDPQTHNVLNPIERITGNDISYPGEDQGYDSVTRMIDNFVYNNQNYFDSYRNLFKVTEVHYRKVEKVLQLWDYRTAQWYNISKAVNLSKDGRKYDTAKMEMVRAAFPDSKIINTSQLTTWQSAVCPALNMVLHDEPYTVQNGYMKPIPIFCFDFGMDSMDWKSYVDHLADPVASFNVDMNTMQTYFMKVASGETWYEEGALGKHEDEFKENKIGAVKPVEPGGLAKIKRLDPPKLPSGLTQLNQFKMGMINDISAIGLNAMGQRETSHEPAAAIRQRIAQTDLMQAYVQNNAVNALLILGRNTLDYTLAYFTPGRIIKITRDETNPYWLEINEDAIRKITYSRQGEFLGEEIIPGNVKNTQVDIILSKAPFGQNQKLQEFQMMMTIAEFLSKLNPQLVNPELLVKSAPLKNRDEWLAYIRSVMGDIMQKTEQQLAMTNKANAMRIAQENMSLREKQLGLQQKQQNVDLGNIINSTVAMASSSVPMQ